MDVDALFAAYASDFERSYADRDWSRLARYFAADAVYECREPEALAFRVMGRDAILERFQIVTETFDRRFDSRELTLTGTQVDGQRVTVTGVVVYTVSGVPSFRLPFAEIAEYRGGEIVRLEDASTPEALLALGEWMARHASRLRG